MWTREGLVWPFFLAPEEGGEWFNGAHRCPESISSSSLVSFLLDLALEPGNSTEPRPQLKSQTRPQPKLRPRSQHRTQTRPQLKPQPPCVPAKRRLPPVPAERQRCLPPVPAERRLTPVSPWEALPTPVSSLEVLLTPAPSSEALLTPAPPSAALLTPAPPSEALLTPAPPSESIGKLLLIELDKHPFFLTRQDAWFPNKVEVKSPEGQTFNFPIYRWITDSEVHFYKEGKALLGYEDTHLLSKYSREKELRKRKEDYQWHVYKQGIPHCMKAENTESLPLEVHFSFTKKTEFLFTAAQGLIGQKLNGQADCTDKWTNMDSISRAFRCNITDISDYVQKHWKEDDFFAYQFLNGVNPMLIRRCTAIPKNFPVTESMVFIHGLHTLEKELKNGNIYLCDYKLLDGVEANTINGKKQYLMAPLVLLHKRPDDKLMPIAIQLKQTSGEDNPIFYPSDTEYDWLMAKIFVRSADFNLHELSIHLLRTHLLAEVFAVSLLRNVPMVHPLYKLLIPHTRYSLHINHMARNQLISDDGVFTKFAACGGEGMFTILKSSMASMTYSSLCIQDDIAERGMDAMPNYFYMDDGLKLWEIIQTYLISVLHFGILDCYYKSDDDIKNDSELQKWISDIFVEGFLSNANTGIPQDFSTVTALVKFVTMVIFTCSVQHSAVNSGQFDYVAWMPNAPSSLQLPPPTTKGTTSEATMLETFPDVNVTVQGMATIHLLSNQSIDFVPLGKYPDEHFFEKIPCKLIKEFQGDLEKLSEVITIRNKNLNVPYTYMNPTVVENSVAI
ncbi:polyunsaturated fatty acid lipoxygenase ALOX15B-like [Labrus mixtus]|uniref:polyunsaturated fatty acid lipoxygenase ALOX15B-like n=1 Tax=Labrus mixtus TaxID=508554 RepID=UPI0029BFC48C|nr:polyunsaturated fatty acid lipoxygenase ALOX15B-like [Labrus mixtus]